MVKKTVSLPADVAREVEELAKAKGQTFSAVIEDALRTALVRRRLHNIQGYWSGKALERGLLNEQDLERYLRG